MVSQRTIRNITIAATVSALAIASGIILWDTIRPLPTAERNRAVLAGRRVIDVSVADALVANPRFAVLVALTPPPTPVKLGNRNPFFVRE